MRTCVKEKKKMKKDNLDLAMQITANGWKVFPCGQDKAPLVPSAHPKGDPLYRACNGGCGKIGHGYHDAARGFDAVYDLWEKSKAQPDTLIGIACAASGLLVVDLDTHPGRPNGVEAFAGLVAAHNAKPEPCGPMQRTAGGGYHLFYKMPKMPAEWEIPGTLAPGIDLKYNGYVCTGTLQDGRAYEWQECHNYDAELTIPPAWILRIISQRNQPKERQAGAMPETPSIEKVRAALSKISASRADDYTDWLKIGFALRELGSAGLELWHEFSKRSAKYDPDVLDKKWDTFAPGKVTLGTIFWMAKTDKGV